LITQWDFGDFYTYYGDAKAVAGTLAIFRPASMQAVVWINALVFTVLPPSIYGLSIIAGCMSFVFTYLIITAFAEHFVVPKIVQYTLMFAPTFSISCGYVGKETFVLPLLGLLVANRHRAFRPWLLRAAVVAVLIWPFRTYQMLFAAAAIGVVWLLERKSIRALIAVAVVGSLLYGIASTFLLSRDLVNRSIGEVLDISYSGGSLMLPPPPFPFTMLQHFRPFPWEAHKVTALLASLEYVWFLGLAITLSCQYFIRRGKGRIIRNVIQRRIVVLAGAWTLFYLVIYQFSENLGDMSRRHVYYYPFIILIFCFPRATIIGTRKSDALAVS